jgi:hypothetical protein
MFCFIFIVFFAQNIVSMASTTVLTSDHARYRLSPLWMGLVSETLWPS